MPDDTPTPTPARPPLPATASSLKPVRSGTPPGQGIRRAMTIDETSSLRRRSTPLSDGAPRRSSNFSEYSLSEARDILNPKPRTSQMDSAESSSLAGLSLAFALLPALAGVLFKNGSAVVTDVMLLGLAGVFLHWSVTQPWSWYHSAQEVRIQHEASSDSAMDEDSELESPAQESQDTSPLDDVPEEEEEGSTADPQLNKKFKEDRRTPQQRSALAELYVYEIAALFSCFLLPLIGAYLLHAIRSQLSRPSEGLVSNYNLTIFLLVSELRVFSHMIKLVQSRTLHLQRVVLGNPFEPKVAANAQQLDDLFGRLERLESRSATEAPLVGQAVDSDSAKLKQEANLARDVRNAIQPELDALNRAVRRYEKKATLLQIQTESRFTSIDARIDDAIALAASAAKNSAPRKSAFILAIEYALRVFFFPFKALVRIVLLPLETLLALVSKGKQKNPGPLTKTSRTGRNGKGTVQPRYSGDRVPTRVAKR